MNRRRLLHAICTAMAGMSLSGMARATSRKRVAVVGVGGAGANLVMALRTNGVLEGANAATTYLCADADERTAQQVRSANAGTPSLPALQSLLLDSKRASTGEAILKPLCRLIGKSDMVVLLAGLGGDTGSTYSRLIAQAARRLGVPTIAAVITPFDFEGARGERAALALEHLRRDASVVLPYSNTEWANRFSDDTPLVDIFDALDRQTAMDARSHIAAWSRSGVRI